MPEDCNNSKNANGSITALKALIAVLSGGLLTMVIANYSETSKNTQYREDHEHAHEHENISCGEFRAGLRRELDLIWQSCGVGDGKQLQKPEIRFNGGYVDVGFSVPVRGEDRFR